MLTRKQQELLLLIDARLAEDGVPPSFEEMKEALGLKSKSGIHRLISALEERGFIRRLPNRARALEIVKLPEPYASQRRLAGTEAASTAPATPAQAGEASSGFTPRVVQGGRSETAPDHDAASAASNRKGFAEPAQAGFAASSSTAPAGTVEVPVMGRIAAGVPISAIQDHTHDIAAPPDMLGPGNHYALKVSGDSMIEAGIHDGDTVVIRETPSADQGDIVVALVDDEEATLKVLRRSGGRIGLEAANPAYETRYLEPERVRVQGRLVGLIRTY